MSDPVAKLRAALILTALACFVSAHLVHYPVGLMALLGLLDMVREPRRLGRPAARLLLLMFALIWVPMALAWPSAVERARSGATVLLYLHFLPAAYFVLRACEKEDVLRLVTAGTAALVLFAAFDAFVQLIWKVDLFGYPYEQGMLKGVFHPKQRLGLFLAVFAPLVVDSVLRWCRQYPQLWLLLIPLVIAVVMSLKRSAWFMLALGMLGYGALWLYHNRRMVNRARLLQLAVVLLITGTTVVLNPSLKNRLEASGGLFSADVEAIDRASGYRLSLWQTGLRIFEAHPLTGVGPRGYRYAYAEHAGADDFWLARSGTGQTHPHLLVLEVAVECGVIGLAAFTLFYILLLRLLCHPTVGHSAPVWLLGAAVAWFPLNAHLAFYGSYWATLAWLMIGVGLAALRMPEAEGPAIRAVAGEPSRYS